jgi:hypothetical protein
MSGTTRTEGGGRKAEEGLLGGEGERIIDSIFLYKVLPE